MDFSILQFCQKFSILSFSERPLYFFRFFNFVKNAQFCHFLRGLWIFRFFNFVKNAQFCHFVREESVFFSKMHLLSILSKTVSILSFLEKWTSNYAQILSFCILCVHVDVLLIYQTIFVKNAPFCHFVRELVYFFFASSILSKMLNFVILWEDYVFFVLDFFLSYLFRYFVKNA